jgi:endonuclease/exonuclease/phosphatase (EEP) superfamily protein YafD
MRMLQTLAALAAFVVLLAVLAGFLGRLHPALDSLGIFRLHLMLAAAVIVLVCALLREGPGQWLALTAMVAAIAGLVPTVIPPRPVPAADLTGWQLNLRFDNADPGAVAAAIRAAAPDIVTLQEVSNANLGIIDALADIYPTRHVCPAHSVGAVAILSRLPAFGAPGCVEGRGLAWVTLTTPDGALTVASIHLHWPWPYRQPEQSADLAERLSRLPGRVILAGDFNAAPWSVSVARLASAIRGRPARGLRITFDRRRPLFPGLPLDHVLASSGIDIAARRGGHHGSDHRAVHYALSLGPGHSRALDADPAQP